MPGFNHVLELAETLMKQIIAWAVDVAQLTEQLLQMPKVRGSNPVIVNC